jgi:hypothetical protein
MRAARVDAVGDAAWKVRTGELEPRGVGVGNRVTLEGDRCPSRSVIHDYSRYGVGLTAGADTSQASLAFGG